METPTFKELIRFVRFALYSFLTLGSVAGVWLGLGLPQLASKDYVDVKFKLASDTSVVVQSQLTSTRIQLNKMSRQSLEREKYRLTEQRKTDNSFALQQRLSEIEQELIDVARERDILLRP